MIDHIHIHIDYYIYMCRMCGMSHACGCGVCVCGIFCAAAMLPSRRGEQAAPQFLQLFVQKRKHNASNDIVLKFLTFTFDNHCSLRMCIDMDIVLLLIHTYVHCTCTCTVHM